MLKSIIKLTRLALLVSFLFAPAMANVWRSDGYGTIFRFQPDGRMTVLRNDGSTAYGRWWWIAYGSQGAYQLGAQTHYVYIQGNRAEVHSPTGVATWTYLGSRGQADADETSEAGWMMAVPATLRPAKEV